MNNKKLFEEAIAEAKSIREAAIANAKEALEESLTPQIKELLAQRLTEMEEEDELPGPPEEKLSVMEEEEEGAEEAGEEKEAGEESEEDMDIEDMSVEELKALIRDIVGQMVDQDGDGDHDMDDHEMDSSDMGMEEPAGEEAPEDEEIDLDELLAELSMEEEEPVMEAPLEEMTDTEITMLVSALGPLVVGGASYAIAKAMDALKAGKAGELGKKVAAGLEDAAEAGQAARKGGQSSGKFEAVEAELNEAKKTIKKLTEGLQDVNLLNAKLLYVNKVLKENKNLSDSQVANVISTFDKAATVKEAKLVYESLSTTFKKGVKAQVAESRVRGIASKSTGVAVKAPEVIAEVSDAVKRMQKLAGIIKN
jgi:hypothetical protein